jgi:hypothetical protein
MQYEYVTISNSNSLQPTLDAYALVGWKLHTIHFQNKPGAVGAIFAKVVFEKLGRKPQAGDIAP